MTATATVKKPRAVSENGHVAPTSTKDVAVVCSALVGKQREREILLKSIIMQANRLSAIVATTDLDYSSYRTDVDKKKLFGQAEKLIPKIVSGEYPSKIPTIVAASYESIQVLDGLRQTVEALMEDTVSHLTIAKWMFEPNQRGLKLLTLAKVIGECGNLSNYSNPGKLWKRMGCAPHAFDGETHMGEAWRKGWCSFKLPAEEWVKYGYNPRRRKLGYVIGDCIVKSNTDKKTGVVGPYRQRYDEAKKAAQEAHPDWAPIHVHKHAMLLASKRFLRELWIEWHRLYGRNER